MVTLWDMCLSFTSTSCLYRSLIVNTTAIISLVFLIIIINCLLLIPSLAVELSLGWVHSLRILWCWDFSLGTTSNDMTLAAIFGNVVVTSYQTSISVRSWWNNIIVLNCWVITAVLCYNLVWLVSPLIWAYHSFLLHYSTSITIIILSNWSWIYLTSSSWVDSLFFHYIVKNSTILALNNCTVINLLIMHQATKVWIILWSYQLCLHTIGYR